MDKVVDVMAHDSEILSIKYSPPNENSESLNYYYYVFCLDSMLLATGSRDRLIHVFDVNGQYSHCNTVDDHSASITAVDFSSNHRDR